MRSELPEFREWSRAAVWLLRGAVYADDLNTWQTVLTNVSTLENYFARIGLRLVVSEDEGMAYLRQFVENEAHGGYESLPRLFRASRLSYQQTLLCVLLRDELRRFEDEDLRDDRCVIDEQLLFDQFRLFFPTQRDEVRLQRDMRAALGKLDELGLVAPFGDGQSMWEIRRLIKARLPIQELEALLQQLRAATESRTTTLEGGE
jgi:uncharacterized protein DUF4194